MFGMILKLLSRKSPAAKFEEDLQFYLLELPRCTGNVLIVSPRYGDQHYSCDLVVSTKELLPWSEHHAQAVWSNQAQEQISRKALPIWLRQANYEDKRLIEVPLSMARMLRPFVANMVHQGIVRTMCPMCESEVIDVSIEWCDERKEGDWSWWTEVWTCPEGHQLYREEHELHVCRRS